MSGFGHGAEIVEPDQVLSEGIYEVKLGMPVDVQVNGYNIRKTPFKIRGIPHCTPNSWDWFNIPNNDPEKMYKWNKAMTKNCDAFGVKRLDFEPSHWAGKTGFLQIGKNTKTGYSEVKWAVLKEEAAGHKPEEKTAEPAQGAKTYPEHQSTDEYEQDENFDF